MPQFDPSVFMPQIFWLIVCFVFLCGMMFWVLVPRLAKVIETRERHLHDHFEQASKLLAEAEALKHEAESKLHEVRISARAKHDEALEAMHAEKERQLHNLHQKTASHLAKYFQRLLDERSVFHQEMEALVTQAVMTLSPTLLGITVSAQTIAPHVQKVFMEKNKKEEAQ